jgi:hypothetical protein
LNGFGLGDLSGIGLEARLAGRKLSSSTWTKFEGNRPIIRLSRRNLPIHHDPSPAFKHSIRSPSMNPRSRFDCNLHKSASTAIVQEPFIPLHPMNILPYTSKETALAVLVLEPFCFVPLQTFYIRSGGFVAVLRSRCANSFKAGSGRSTLVLSSIYVRG